jgi:hypothetical protein
MLNEVYQMINEHTTTNKSNAEFWTHQKTHDLTFCLVFDHL